MDTNSRLMFQVKISSAYAIYSIESLRMPLATRSGDYTRLAGDYGVAIYLHPHTTVKAIISITELIAAEPDELPPTGNIFTVINAANVEA